MRDNDKDKGNPPVRIVSDASSLKELWAVLDRCAWLGFDTEFIGEKREIPLLCMLQVLTDEAVWLVDPIKVEGWEHFGTYLSNPGILKLTHAGENDYRLMYQLLGSTPRNTFDLQVASGFVGLRYPASLGTILQEILRVNAAKAFTVADWSVRPLPEKMLQYAVEDVRYLKLLHDRILHRLSELGRSGWVEEEMAAWELPGFYTSDPLKKLLQQKSIASFSEREKLFMMRLATWREVEAVSTKRKSEEILSNKQLQEMAKVISSGGEALFRSRILPKVFIRQMKDRLLEWYDTPASSDELATLYLYAPKAVIDPVIEARTQLVLQVLQSYCAGEELSVDLLLPGSEAKKYRIFPDYHFEGLDRGWRRTFLPTAWRDLLDHRAKLHLQVREDGILLSHNGG